MLERSTTKETKTMAEQRKAPAKRVQAEPQQQHETSLSTVPEGPGVQGGRVQATCTCGWSAHDSYSRDRFADSVCDVVREAADRHVEGS
jgi:hypothetical protein